MHSGTALALHYSTILEVVGTITRRYSLRIFNILRLGLLHAYAPYAYSETYVVPCVSICSQEVLFSSNYFFFFFC